VYTAVVTSGEYKCTTMTTLVLVGEASLLRDKTATASVKD